MYIWGIKYIGKKIMPVRAKSEAKRGYANPGPAGTEQRADGSSEQCHR